MNIVLTGPMGSGKTAVGEKLAKELGRGLIDTDQLVVENAGMSIVGIFKAQGQGKFRELEESVIADVARLDNHVIATGGGVVLRFVNMRRLRRNGLVINLKASVETLFERLKDNTDRPLLNKQNPKEELRKHSEGRAPFYKNADFVIETDGLNVEQVADRIIKIVKQPRIRVCTCIAGEHPAEQIEAAVKDGASLVELRLDLIENPNIASLIAMSGLPVIATDRKDQQNLIRAIEADCDFIDIEAGSNEKERVIEKARLNDCKVIVSAHNFEGTPENLTRLVELTKGGDISKIVTTAKSEKDCKRVLSLLGKEQKIALCMGEVGKETRIRAPFCGSFLTYSGDVALGQTGTREMVEKLKGIQANLKQLCIIGDPVEHSLSPAMHNAAIRELGLEAEFTYMKEHVVPEKLGDFVEKIRGGEISGASVTIPHKQAVLQLADELTREAEQIRAANTLFMREGKLVAHNTDAAGFLRALKENDFDPVGKKVILLGTGGAARAIAHSLGGAKEIVIVNRTKRKAEALAGELENARVGENEECDLLVNATPVCPVDEIRADVVMDINYSPIRTKLLKLAEENRTKTILGTEMLLHQGAEQFEIFTGREAPVEVMRKALREALNEPSG